MDSKRVGLHVLFKRKTDLGRKDRCTQHKKGSNPKGKKSSQKKEDGFTTDNQVDKGGEKRCLFLL